jgi:Pyruvate phosphate dikinase, AMP/ATP-binding domain
VPSPPSSPSPPSLPPHAPWYYAFHDLMPYRVREILLVSSPYDAFTLEEDGRLTERLSAEYSDLALTSAPRITHAPTGARALELLKERHFDLVLTMPRLEDADVPAFGRRVKELYSHLPVVLLSFSEADLRRFPALVDRSVLDGVFVWTGDARILPAIIKIVEDAKNVEHDTDLAGVRVIVVVEDSIRRYSAFLTLLYAELTKQSASLIAEGVNDAHKLMRMQARPKILLAVTFEEAVHLVERYREWAVALISDVRFPRAGKEDPEAGFELLRRVRALDPELPVLLQSAEREALDRASRLGVPNADKNSTSLLRQIRDFMKESLGFGDFIFRLADRTEVARARNVFEMQEVLKTVPAASVEYHGSRNHFSMWLMARSMFGLAERLRPRTIAELGGVESARQHILSVLLQARVDEEEGMITDFSSRRAGARSLFVRLGRGSIGGKARGIAFVNSLLAHEGLPDRIGPLELRTPRTVAIGTDEFDRFMEDNKLYQAVEKLDDRALLERFLAAHLPEELARELEAAWAEMNGPIAVRSSSLLEDAQFQAFAGIYATYMLPNEHPNPHVRFDELLRAVKAVYASTFSRRARAYLESTPYTMEDEKMGVVLQEMVGRRYGPRFYPHASGVALSYNYYPVEHQRAEDGLAMVALGLGHTVVLGGAALQFSPRSPGSLPQFPSPADFLAYSQSSFYALDMTRATTPFVEGSEASLRQCELADAEADGTLALVGSVYSAEDDRIRDDLKRPGTRLVTFNNVLRWKAIPLAPAIDTLLRVARGGMGCAVEIEFALDARGLGAPPVLYVLQIRPQATVVTGAAVDPMTFPDEKVLCRTSRSLGHGIVRDLLDVVYVTSRVLDARAAEAAAGVVAELNAALVASRTPYVLIGPGRWGTSDPRLGVPVGWAQIAGARIIVETSAMNRAVLPSQGSHFFHNITSLGVGYLTVEADNEAEAFLDLDWLDAQPAAHEAKGVRHVRLAQPLTAHLDGRRGTAAVVKA